VLRKARAADVGAGSLGIVDGPPLSRSGTLSLSGAGVIGSLIAVDAEAQVEMILYDSLFLKRRSSQRPTDQQTLISN
jgi:hypothetical protein